MTSEGHVVDEAQNRDLDPGLLLQRLCVLLTAESCCFRWEREKTWGGGVPRKDYGGRIRTSPALPGPA